MDGFVSLIDDFNVMIQSIGEFMSYAQTYAVIMAVVVGLVLILVFVVYVKMLNLQGQVSEILSILEERKIKE